jgi:hypothetical protein
MLGHKITFGIDTAEEIMRIIHGPLERVVTDAYVCFFVTDANSGITVFNRELFRATVDSDETRFFDALVESMTFRAYVENRLARFTDERVVGVRMRMRMPTQMIPIEAV